MAARLRARLRFLTWGMLRFLLTHSVTNGKNEKGVPANFFVYSTRSTRRSPSMHLHSRSLATRRWLTHGSC